MSKSTMEKLETGIKRKLTAKENELVQVAMQRNENPGTSDALNFLAGDTPIQCLSVSSTHPSRAFSRSSKRVFANGYKAIAYVFSIAFPAGYEKQKIQQFLLEASNYANNIDVPVLNSYSNSFLEDIKVPICSVIAVGEKMNKALQPDQDPKELDQIYSLTHKSNLGNGTSSHAISDKILMNALMDIDDPRIKCYPVSCDGLAGSTYDVALHHGKGADINFEDGVDNLSGFLPGASLVVAPKGLEQSLKEICDTWEVALEHVGSINGSGRLHISSGNTELVDLPIDMLEIAKNDMLEQPANHSNSRHKISFPGMPGDIVEIANKMTAFPGLGLKDIFSPFFDHSQGSISRIAANKSNVLTIPTGGGATNLLMGQLTMPCGRQDDFEASIPFAIAESAREMLCAGGEIKGMNLTFYCQACNEEALQKAVDKAYKKLKMDNCQVRFKHCQKLGQETIILIDSVGFVDGSPREVDFKNKGDMIYLVGKNRNNLENAQYLQLVHDVPVKPYTAIDLDHELAMYDAITTCHDEKLLNSAISVSSGGIYTALVDCVVNKTVGFDITSDSETRLDAFLFEESPGRIIVSVSPGNQDRFIDIMMEKNIPFTTLGHVTKEELRIDDLSFGFGMDIKEEYQRSFKI